MSNVSNPLTQFSFSQTSRVRGAPNNKFEQNLPYFEENKLLILVLSSIGLGFSNPILQLKRTFIPLFQAILLREHVFFVFDDVLVLPGEN